MKKFRIIAMLAAILVLGGILAGGIALLATGFEEPEPQSEKAAAEPEKAQQPDPEPAAAETYTADAAALMGQFNAAMETFSQQNTAVGQNGALFQDDEWIAQTGAAVAKINMAIEDINDLEAPAEYAEYHNLLLDAMDHFEYAMMIYPQAVDNMDPEAMQLALDSVLAGNDALKIANDHLENK